MKKKHSHRSASRASRRPPRPRNASTGLAPVASRPRSRVLARASAAPDWKTIAAAVAGGAGSAALGGLVVNQQILSPEAVGIGLMLGGGATAYFSEGTSRIVGTSVAASGAGQFALAIMNKRALKAHHDANIPAVTSTTGSGAMPSTPLQLAPPPAVAQPRRSASGGGIVVDLFREASHEIDRAQTLDDEWRYGIRDDGYGGTTADPVVIDLDEAG